jgi:hypothetical protein
MHITDHPRPNRSRVADGARYDSDSAGTEFPGAPPKAAPQADTGFEIIIGTSGYDRPVLDSDWRRMLDDSRSTERLYQSPEFFRYLIETAGPGDGRVELIVIKKKSGSEIVGVVPVRVSTQSIDFRLGTRTLVSRRLSVIQILGSAPMLSDAPGLLRYLMNYLLQYVPGTQAIVMQALTEALYDDYCGSHGLGSYVLHGWRDCHTIPLPASFEEYLQKFSAKKRYNLSRQVRMLAKEAGPVSFERVYRAEQVTGLFEAITSVVPRREYEHLARPAKFERLAANGLLLSYVIRAGEEPVAVVVATQWCGIWHVHNIFSTRKYQHLSAGTSAMHLALEDLIANFSFTDVDFGYGTPSSDFRSTHMLKTRGHVLLYRPVGLTAALLAVHRVYDHAHEALVKHLKQARKKFDERRSARQKRAPEPK